MQNSMLMLSFLENLLKPTKLFFEPEIWYFVLIWTNLSRSNFIVILISLSFWSRNTHFGQIVYKELKLFLKLNCGTIFSFGTDFLMVILLLRFCFRLRILFLPNMSQVIKNCSFKGKTLYLD